MKIKGPEDLARIIARRDNISENEAMNLVEGCINEIEDILSHDGTLFDAEDAVASWLGLEPDYLDILLPY